YRQKLEQLEGEFYKRRSIFLSKIPLKNAKNQKFSENFSPAARFYLTSRFPHVTMGMGMVT
ncbi:MAG: hypothetical protein Q4D62_15265, partial [Planctomycetia bacterium]|nr:hypothetical protein [Planctomycetia bacterium]